MQKVLKLSIAVVILALIILSAPFGMGILAEKEAQKKAKEFQAKLTHYPNIEYRLVAYKRGFFKSSAEELLVFKSIKVDGKELGPIELVFSDEIKHGPLVVSKDKTGKHHLWLGRALIKGKLIKTRNLGIQPLPMPLYTGHIDFRGDIKIAIEIPKLKFDFPSFSVAFEDLKDQIAISNDGKKIINQLDLKKIGLADKGKPQQLEIGELSTTSEVKKNEQSLWLGSRKLEIGSLVAVIEGKTYTLKGIYSKTKEVEHNKQIKTEVIFNIRSAAWGENAYGPHRLVLDVDGIDASILSKLNDTFGKINREQQLVEQKGTLLPATNAELIRNQALVNKLGALAADLVKKGFKIDLKSLELATAWGPLTASSHIQVPNLSGPQNNMGQLSILSSIFNMDLTLNAQLPSGLVRMLIEERYKSMLAAQTTTEQAQGYTQPNIADLTDKHLRKLVTDGWLIPKNNLYDIHLSFKKGEFLVNNNPLKPYGILPELVPPPAPENKTTAPATSDDHLKVNSSTISENNINISPNTRITPETTSTTLTVPSSSATDSTPSNSNPSAMPQTATPSSINPAQSSTPIPQGVQPQAPSPQDIRDDMPVGGITSPAGSPSSSPTPVKQSVAPLESGDASKGVEKKNPAQKSSQEQTGNISKGTGA